MIPLLPRPVTPTRPVQANSASTARSKLPSMRGTRSRIARASISSTLRAVSRDIASHPTSGGRGGVYPQEPGEEGLQPVQPVGVGAVGEGAGRILVDLHEEAVHAGGHARRRQRVDEMPIAPGAVAETPWPLHAVRDVEHDREAEGAQGGERAHVHDQVVVAEGEAPLGHHHLAVARGRGLVERALHVPRGHELALLDVDDAPRTRRLDDEIGLPAEEGGDLEDVGHLRRLLHLRHLVHVGEDRDAVPRTHAGEDLEALVDPGAAVRAQAGPVRLVVAGLEHEGDPQRGRDLLEAPGELRGMARVLDHARAGDQEEGPGPAGHRPPETVAAQDGGPAQEATVPPASLPAARIRRFSTLARTKSAKRGWGASGFDLNSGWNCTATYQGWSVISAISTNLPSGVLPEMVRPACVRQPS